MIENMTPDAIDTLGEVGNIMMGAGATNLASLLGERVDITAPEVLPGAVQDVWPDGQALLVELSMVGAVSGESVFVLPAGDVEVIVSIMCAGMELAPEDILGEMGLSAVGEAMNQLMAGSAIALSDVLGELVRSGRLRQDRADRSAVPAFSRRLFDCCRHQRHLHA